MDFKYFQKLDETDTKLKIVSGYNMDELLEKFMAGWRLVPPENFMSLGTTSPMQELLTSLND